MKKVISSQRYLDYEIIDEKVEFLKGCQSVSLPVIDSGMKDLDGNDLLILIDGTIRRKLLVSLVSKSSTKKSAMSMG